MLVSIVPSPTTFPWSDAYKLKPAWTAVLVNLSSALDIDKQLDTALQCALSSYDVATLLSGDPSGWPFLLPRALQPRVATNTA